jgi:hypothetical protein
MKKKKPRVMVMVKMKMIMFLHQKNQTTNQEEDLLEIAKFLERRLLQSLVGFNPLNYQQ